MLCSACSATVRPVVCLDIDGTLAQYHLGFVEFAEKWLNEPPLSLPRSWDGIGEFSDCLGLDLETYRKMKLAFRAGGFKRWMEAFSGAAHLTQALVAQDVEVWMTTTRPWMRMDNIDPDTKEWLHRHNVMFDHLLFDEDKYGLIANLVDPRRIVLVLDDEVHHLSRCRQLGLPFALRRTAWNYGVRHDGTVVTQLDQALAIVQERIGTFNAQH